MRPKNHSSLVLRLTNWLVWVGVVGVTTATLMIYVAPQWWISDLLSHLQAQFSVALLLAFLWFLLQSYWLGLLVLIPLSVNLSVLLPLYSASAPAIATKSPHIHLLHYNLDIHAAEHHTAFAYLRGQAVDILLLQEVTPDLLEQMRGELPDYRVVHAHPLTNTHGSALLMSVASKIQVLAVGEVHLPKSSARPLITATLALDGHPFSLLSLHVIRPKDEYTEAIQAVEYEAAATWVRDQHQWTGYPMLVLGDYNSTPWSARFQAFLRRSGLRDSSHGFGYQPTWPAFAPALFAIPIDHATFTQGIAVVDRAVGPNLGGDHTPLQLTIALGQQQ